MLAADVHALIVQQIAQHAAPTSVA